METTYDMQIEQIVQSIFSTMLNLDVVRVEANPAAQPDPLLVAIHITGEWTGTVVLGLSRTMIRSAAAAMLQLPEEQLGEADEQEVAAELVNMIGGNLKSLLAAPSYLSLPTIVAGQQFGLRIHEAELIEEVFLAGEDGMMRVAVFIRNPETST